MILEPVALIYSRAGGGGNQRKVTKVMKLIIAASS